MEEERRGEGRRGGGGGLALCLGHLRIILFCFLFTEVLPAPVCLFVFVCLFVCM